MSRPLVAVVGRPNVGKSTLFNRLTGQRIAIVEDIPGVTRDRHYADASILGRDVVLVDTGGFDPDSDDPMTENIVRQVRLALSEADLVVCVLDASAEPLPSDREAVQLLRESEKPVIFAANKADSPRRAHEATVHYELGIPSLVAVSALHGHGIGDLEEAILKALPEATQSADDAGESFPRIAVVGRPNAGKSSLVNRLLQEDRQIVDDRPGTTVDSIDTLVQWGDDRFVVIDTAGIRRKRSVAEGVEAYAVLQSLRAVERSDLVVLMIDAKTGAAEQDAKIANLAVDRGRALVIGLNKIDVLDSRGLTQATQHLGEVLGFASWAPQVRLSAKTGRGVNRLMAAVQSSLKAHAKRVSTSDVNRFFEEVLERHPPPTMHGKSVRLFYVTQAQTSPPTFVAMANEPDSVHPSYRRYVVNQIRERFGFQGTPVRVFYRKRRRRGDPA